MAFYLNRPYILTGSSDDTVRLWNSTTGAEVRRIELHQDLVTQVKFSPDGRFLLMVNRDRTLRLWDIARAREVRRFKGHTNTIYSADFSPDNRRILSGGEDATARLWNIAAGVEEKQVQLPNMVYAVAFLDNTHYVFSGAWNPARKCKSMEATPLVWRRLLSRRMAVSF
jgi:WD40 repeat protein